MTTVQEVFQRERDDLIDTELCQQARNFVTYRGSEDPTVLFVGEAPGAEEDKQGKPFVGRSGTILDDWIEAADLDGEFAITNVVKCRPPENRTPTDEESERFGTWLDEEIDAMEPAIIVPLGKTATRSFLDIEGSFLEDTCEQTFETEQGTVYPLPHPAYALRSGYEPDLDHFMNVIGEHDG